ncbi:hypothetical protein BJ875DRAFT_520242 [Amylocarpus encephaloides]|uniref:Major facilitator superfamily (MFS) profile domain-containing protein n=1 Tax=Amylocarpus encephaloides TaxID=45428 RepID=A0A9P7YPN5_9HELO|nr:hypothetical protein BJ875DRAFT_520242 [Amylocarpus encephaloides]
MEKSSVPLEEVTPVSVKSSENDQIHCKDEVTTAPREDGIFAKEEETLSLDAQAGVLKMQAATSVWSKSHIYIAYGLIWLIYFVVSLQELVIQSLNPYVTSSFSRHALTAATGIMASIIGGLAKIPLAKILDTWGRPQGMTLMLVIWIFGYIMMASCENVQTYAAAQVFSSTGAQGISYCLTVFISDTTALKSRSLMLAFATSPYIITSWVGGPVAQKIVGPHGVGFRWGFGIFTICIPIVVGPLIALFLWNHRKARKLGLIGHTRVSLSPKSIRNYAIEVDLIGIIILAAGFALFLLPFSIYSYQPDKWRSPMIICMITFGGALIIFFGFYEKYLAPKTFIPFELLMDRTVFLAGMMFVFVFFNSIVWGSYFFSMLQVVWGLSIINASYVSAIYRVGSCFFAIFVGLAIRLTGRFKWIAVYFAIPMMMLGVGLMIHFRTAQSDIGYIIMTQIFVAFSGGTIVLCGEMAMMAPSDHQHIAVILAILNLFSSIGSAAGGTVATAIWTSVFPQKLKEYLPPDAPFADIYGSIVWQMVYERGSPTRVAIERAYADAQRLMLVTSVCLLGGAFICVALWRDINVKNIKQTKGHVI